MCWSRQPPAVSTEQSNPSRAMSDMRRVAVYDIESKNLRKLPLKAIPAEAFTQVKVPRFGRFDIYASNEDVIDSECSSVDVAYGAPRQPRSVQVVNSVAQDTKGMSFRTRVNFGGLGPFTNVKRVFSSRSRMLYIGAVPT